MVICCVPSCKSDSWNRDSSVTFYDFPSDPDLTAKWIQQINRVLHLKPMWFPRGKPVICSKHFVQTDFKDDSESLKPRSVPTIFGCRYYGPSLYLNEPKTNSNCTETPLIVKIKRNGSVLENNSCFKITDVCSKAHESKLSNHEQSFSKSNHAQNNTSFLCSSPNNIISGSNSSGNVQSQQQFHVTANIQEALSILSTNRENVSSTAVNKEGKLGSAFIKTKLNVNNTAKTYSRKRQKCNSDVIEIGPNTFLKINPDIIKVNKKLTPSGNTVLQFLMDQKVAQNSPEILPQVIKKMPSVQNRETCTPDSPLASNATNEKSETLQVLGHLVDSHVCEDEYSDLKLNETSGKKNNKEHEQINDVPSNPDENAEMTSVTTSKKNPLVNKTSKSMPSAVSTCLNKAPVLMTTNVPLSNILLEKPKYLLQMKQKSRQIASLKMKLATLTKKIEELEDRCVVQERQLSYSFIKKLKSIRKNSSKGDPCATYILEQIRCYTGTFKMRWSDSTLTQCAIWCRKAPYAYEYFRKADFFKLPCLGTVKRYMKKHPELKVQKKLNGVPNNNEDESSSDFDFDESDSADDKHKEESEESSNTVPCETILTVPSETESPQTVTQTSELQTSVSECNAVNSVESNLSNNSTETSRKVQNVESHQGNKVAEKAEVVQGADLSSFPITVDGSNLEVQEIMLPSGEVVQCYSSNIGTGEDGGNQYYIIPNIDQNSIGDHEYSIVQTETLPLILQNIENSQLSLQQQEQLIFITNSTDQVGCNETEVTSV